MASGSMTVSTAKGSQVKARWWRNVRVLRIAFQVVFAVVILALLRYLFVNVTANLRASGLPTDFGFLNQPTGYDIRGADFSPSQPISDALWIGFLNTVRVAVSGIVLATVLGVLVGVGRLSVNWLVRTSTGIYVEMLRNTPVLLTIGFMYFAVMLAALPPIANAAEPLGLTVLSTRGLWVPWIEAPDGAGPALLLVAAAVGAGVAIAVWRTRRFNRTGIPHRRFVIGAMTTLLVLAVGQIALGQPLAITVPVRDGRLVVGGIAMEPAFAALLAGLVLYTSSHIAEIVRGSILAIHRGQGDAAMALGLNGFQRLRFVILPQAFRIAVPSMASQYLNLTKNSSLAIFIGYVEYTRITFTNIGNANPAPQSIVVLGLGYLVLSLIIATMANLVNRSLALRSN